MSVEIRLRKKYRLGASSGRQQKSNYGGNHKSSNGKHLPHPDVHGFRTRGYNCDPKWNQKLLAER